MSIRFKDSGGGSALKMRLIKVAATVTLSGVAAIMPFAALADHSTAHTIEQLTAQIAALQAQLTSLGTGVAAPAAAAPAVAPAVAMADKCTFTRSLFQGVRGDDVKCLQDSLTAAGHYTYSGGSTGYFGGITKSAVAAWQAANGVSPAVGYFGPISRAKYDSMIMAAAPAAAAPAAAAPAAAAPAAAAPAAAAPAAAAPAVAAGSGLTVSMPADQPAATLAPQSVARLPFVRVILTASADGDVTVKSVTTERQGLSDDSAFADLVLLDEMGTRIGLAKTLNASHRALFDESFVVKAGTSKTFTVAANMDSDLGGEAGQVAKFAVVAVDAGTTKVNGAFPIVGNGMTINSTLAIGTLASPARGVLDPGAGRTALEVGSKSFYASGVRWSVGSQEPVIVESMRWYQSGSAASSDIGNVKVNLKGVDYDATVSSDGKYYDVKFGAGIELDKGAALDIGIKVDVMAGSGRNIDFDLQRRTDIVVRGKTFGYYVTPANDTADEADDGGTFSNVEPYYDAYQHTVSGGTIRVEKSSSVAAGSVGVDVSNTPLGAFTFEVKGEPIQLTRIILNFTFTGTGTSSDITGVALYDANGNVVAGPKDPSSGNVTVTDTIIVPVGLNVYTVKGKLDTTFVTNDTVVVSLQPRNMTARGQVTGLTVTADPNSQISVNTQTVRAAAMGVSVSPSPSTQNVVRGVNGFLFAKYQFDATASGEDMRVTQAIFRDVLDATGSGDEVNSCQAFDGATALNTGSNVLSPTDPTTVNNDLTFTFDNHLVVPKGTTKVVEMKCNISPNAAAASTHQFGLVATDGNVVAVGKDTGTAITETLTAAGGQVMTVRTSGVLTVSRDASSPVTQRYGIAGKTDILLTVLKFRADYEPITLTRLALTLSSSTASTSDLADARVTLWDGATRVGDARFTVGTRGTSTLSTITPFVIPKDGEKLLTIKGDLAPVGLGKEGTRGRLIAVNHDGEATSTTRGTGQSSGVTINPAQGADTDGAGVRLVKSYPTLERLPITSNVLPTSGDTVLYRFKVAADAAGDVGLYKFTFRVSSTTAATTSAFKVYAYSDSGFTAPAYAANPVNSNDVDCLGSSSVELGSDANDDCGANNQTNTPATRTASTTEVAVYFDPSTNVANTPNAESINVPAGTTRYFQLNGNVTRGTIGDAISVALLGDAGVAVNTNTVGRENADTVDESGTTTYDNFIWSPNSTTTAATSTNADWLNGYVVPGLPSTEMTAQTLSR